jgi:hypothetical protein
MIGRACLAGDSPRGGGLSASGGLRGPASRSNSSSGAAIGVHEGHATLGQRLAGNRQV